MEDRKKPPRVLIVEDDASIRVLYKELFNEAGYQVEAVSDGVQAEEVLDHNAYDATLLDIMLPKKDGISLLKGVASEVKERMGQVVLLTNLGQDVVIKEGLSLGAAGYLIKSSVTPGQVLRKVTEILAEDVGR